MTSYIRIGGLALEPPRGWEKVVRKFINGFPPRSTSTRTSSTRIRSSARTQGVGHCSGEDLLDLGVTGPMIRAAGMPWDIRKCEPYSSYEKFDFDDCRARPRATCTRGIAFASRRCAQSARIVEQALAS